MVTGKDSTAYGKFSALLELAAAYVKGDGFDDYNKAVTSRQNDVLFREQVQGIQQPEHKQCNLDDGGAIGKDGNQNQLPLFDASE